MKRLKESFAEAFNNDPIDALLALSLFALMIGCLIFLLVVLPIGIIAGSVQDDPAPQPTQGEWK